MARPLLSSHSSPAKTTCDAKGCARRVTAVSVHIVTPANGDGQQALLVGQYCDLHAAALLEELRTIAEVRAPLAVWHGGRDG